MAEPPAALEASCYAALFREVSLSDARATPAPRGTPVAGAVVAGSAAVALSLLFAMPLRERHYETETAVAHVDPRNESHLAATRRSRRSDRCIASLAAAMAHLTTGRAAALADAVQLLKRWEPEMLRAMPIYQTHYDVILANDRFFAVARDDDERAAQLAACCGTSPGGGVLCEPVRGDRCVSGTALATVLQTPSVAWFYAGAGGNAHALDTLGVALAESEPMSQEQSSVELRLGTALSGAAAMDDVAAVCHAMRFCDVHATGCVREGISFFDGVVFAARVAVWCGNVRALRALLTYVARHASDGASGSVMRMLRELGGMYKALRDRRGGGATVASSGKKAAAPVVLAPELAWLGCSGMASHDASAVRSVAALPRELSTGAFPWNLDTPHPSQPTSPMLGVDGRSDSSAFAYSPGAMSRGGSWSAVDDATSVAERVAQAPGLRAVRAMRDVVTLVGSSFGADERLLVPATAESIALSAVLAGDCRMLTAIVGVLAAQRAPHPWTPRETARLFTQPIRHSHSSARSLAVTALDSDDTRVAEWLLGVCRVPVWRLVADGAETAGTEPVLHALIRGGRTRSLAMLVKHGLTAEDCFPRRADGASLFHTAAAASDDGARGALRCLVDTFTSQLRPIAMAFAQGQQPVHVAATNGDVALIRLIVKAGVAGRDLLLPTQGLDAPATTAAMLARDNDAVLRVLCEEGGAALEHVLAFRDAAGRNVAQRAALNKWTEVLGVVNDVRRREQPAPPAV